MENDTIIWQECHIVPGCIMNGKTVRINCRQKIYRIILKEIMMGYVRVADTSDVPVDTMKTVVAGGKEILLSNVDGSYYAIANKCTHLGGSLGKVFGGRRCHMSQARRKI